MRTLFTFILILLLYAELYSQWTLQNKLTYQTDFTSVYFTDQNNGYAVGDLGFLFTTNDGGSTWSPGGIFLDMENFQRHLYKGKLNSIFITSNIPGAGQNKYFVGDKGTIIKITGNNYWADKQITTAKVSLNSIYFISPDIGYICGNSGTILKTTNGGTTWITLTTDANYSLSSIYFTDSNTGYAVGGQNTTKNGIILKTTNAGNTWQVKYSGQANRYLYSIHFENSTTGWACGWNGTMLKTTNGGTSWVLQTSGVTSHLKSLCFKSLQEGIAVGTNGTLIVTTNGGTNWGKMLSNTTEQLNSVSIIGSNTVVAMGNKGVILRNENGGTTWLQHPVIYNGVLSKVLFTSQYAGWINAGGLLYKTTNGGQSWIWKRLVDSVIVNDFTFINDQVGWATSTNYVLKTTNGGESWNVCFDYYTVISRSEAISSTSIFCLDNNYGWIALIVDEFYAYIFSTKNGGSSWEKIADASTQSTYIFHGEYSLKVYFQDINIGYLAGVGNSSDINISKLYKTYDGGKNWKSVSFSPSYYEWSELKDIKFSGNKGFIVGSYGESYFDEVHQFIPGAMIIKSTDGGQNWFRKDYNLPGYESDFELVKKLNSISFPTAAVGYTVGSAIMKTTDSGNSWFLQNPGLSGELNSVYFTDADNGWAVGDNGVIMKHQKEAVTAQINWVEKIKIFNKDDQLFDSLQFGQNINATNGLDNSLGETELPPVPPGGTFDVRFILPDDPSISTDKDIRSTNGTNISWNINVQYQDFPLKISWDAAGSLKLIPGEFYLFVDGSMIKINMKETTQVIIESLPQSNSITIIYHSPEYNITEGINIKYDDGWNLISIPLKEDNMTRTDMFYGFFNGILSDLFGFDGKYYIPENLENGIGYWAKLGYRLLPFSGVQVYHPVNVKKGWNIIGPFALDVPINKITTQPAGIITTPFYGFDNGYFSASTLNPGRGYWIKANSDGVINYNVTGLSKGVEPLAANQNNSGKITITDNSGSSTALYDVIDKNINLQQYEMPPLPPSGIFDARYNSGLLAERLDADGKAIVLNSASYPVTIKADGIDLRLGYSVNGIRTETILQNGSSYTIKESSVRVIEVKKTADRIIPKQFSLHQNYPNPFNPKTKIKYDLPEKSKVNLSVFNILGERIAELVNGEMEAGYHEVEFNANSIASGVYIYRIDTDKDHSVKKMLLLK